VEAILRIADISPAPSGERRPRAARAEQAVIAQWLRDQATPHTPQPLSVSDAEPAAEQPEPLAVHERGTGCCPQAGARRSLRARSRPPARPRSWQTQPAGAA